MSTNRYSITLNAFTAKPAETAEPQQRRMFHGIRGMFHGANPASKSLEKRIAFFLQRASQMRQRAADLRLTMALRHDPPPWDRELSLAMDRWIVAMEACR